MFRREPHRALEPVLAALDGAALERFEVALGGATRIALQFGEVRVSRDIDLLCSSAKGWAALRTAVAEQGYRALFSDPSAMGLPRPPTADQYGVRFAVVSADTSVKVEIIREARFALGDAVRTPFCALPCLSIGDVFTEKVLANADRGADPSQFDRDVLDLAVLRVACGPIPTESYATAERAYGPSARTALIRSVDVLRRDPHRLARAMRALRVDDEALVERGLAMLVSDLGLPPVEP